MTEVALHRYSEPYNPTGSIAAEGVRNQLGRPDMRLLTLLVREAAQNMWDARAGDQVVECGFHGRSLDRRSASTLRTALLSDPPPGLPLDDALMDPVTVLLLTDRGTSGLGGPVRADVVTDEAHDFADFVRNVGQPPDKRFGGGTFGYGKGALYLASGAKTIVVHTRCDVHGRLESRLIICGLGPSYHARVNGSTRPFTGRHWWGRYDPNDGIIDPLFGEQAEQVARLLDLPDFDGDDRGTNIMIVDPILGDRDPREAMEVIANAIVWNFWPKMVDHDGRPEMRFRASWNGEEVDVPTPESHPPLHGFVRALEAAAESPDPGVEVWMQRPRRRLGRLAFQRFAKRDRMTDADPEQVGAAFEGPSHHVALLREPRLVVRYLAGPELPDEFAEYAGVFLADRDLDGVFAEAEPPTHDDWVAAALENRESRSIVRITLRRIVESTEEFSIPELKAPGRGVDLPLGAVANHLASLLPAQDGPGAAVLSMPPSRSHPKASGGPGADPAAEGTRGETTASVIEPRKGRANIAVGNPAPLMLQGARAIRVPFHVIPAPAARTTRVTFRVGVAILNGDRIETDPPLGTAVPDLIMWENGRGDPLPREAAVEVDSTDGSEWAVVVSCPTDTAVGLEFDAEAIT